MFSEAVRSRLESEPCMWMTTVKPNGQPQTSLVWFLVDGDDIVMYSLADSPRPANVESNPAVALNLDSNGRGGGVVTMEGSACIDESIPPVPANARYLEKYGGNIERGSWKTPEVFAAKYSVPIRIEIDRVRAW